MTRPASDAIATALIEALREVSARKVAEKAERRGKMLSIKGGK
jgi:hypothetical protein